MPKVRILESQTIENLWGQKHQNHKKKHQNQQKKTKSQKTQKSAKDTYV